MKVMVLGADGYLGWPTAMYLAAEGHDILAVDGLNKRLWEAEVGVQPLFPLPTFQERVNQWRMVSGPKNDSYKNFSPTRGIVHAVCDIATNPSYFDKLLREFIPDAIIHYAEQPSAPYSHISARTCVDTQRNNVIGTLNLIFSVLRHTPNCHIIKLGTMGEYGTPNIDIEEGWLDITHKGREDRMLFPKRPGSWYHLSKVHDSANLEFACRAMNLRVSDLNQGVVYGIHTNETWLSRQLCTSYHYDAIFGTVINRFLCQAAIGVPLSVYGSGGQTRGFLNIVDTLKCVQLALGNPAKLGEFRVFNQFTEQFSIQELAERISRLDKDIQISNIKNPRVEAEDHYYNAKHTALPELGLEPTLLTDAVLEKMYRTIYDNRGRIDTSVMMPDVRWKQ
jgi:UDP-sulfoquinovose synthase